MLKTKAKPAGIGVILTKEFMEPMGLTPVALADAMYSHESALRSVQRSADRHRADGADPRPCVVEGGVMFALIASLP